MEAQGRLAASSCLVVINDRINHYALCPDSDMKLEEYKRLLVKLSADCERIRKL